MKLFERWKEEWWRKNAAKLALEYTAKRADLVRRCEEEMAEVTSKWNSGRELFLIKIRNEEEDLNYKLRLIEERKKEALKADNDLKDLIKTLEAKASPSSVWAEAFTAGFNKSWDMMLPVMTDGMEKIKKSIEDNAIQNTLRRMNGNHKTNH